MLDREREKNIYTTMKTMVSISFFRDKNKKQKHARKHIL